MASTVVFRVDELLAERGWTVVRLASIAGLDPKTVRNIVNRRATRVDLATLGRLSDALEVPPGDLLTAQPDVEDRWKAWERLDGIAGERSDDEEWPGGHSVETNPALERATRSWP